MPRKPCDLTQAKIYRVVSFSTGKQYIGSTTGTLSHRLSQHKSLHKKGDRSRAICEILDCGDAEIYLVETVECKTHEELRRREYDVIQETDCVNKIMPCSTNCKHDKLKHLCVDCNGASTCEHGKIKYLCIECMGNGICEHKKQKTRCVECGGGSICEHNISRYTCVECMGTGVCEHKIERRNCVDCKGSAICPHNRIKHQCVDCKGSQICVHNKRKNTCIECEGSGAIIDICVCGSKVKHCSIARHLKTLKHREYILLNTPP